MEGYLRNGLFNHRHGIQTGTNEILDFVDELIYNYMGSSRSTNDIVFAVELSGAHQTAPSRVPSELEYTKTIHRSILQGSAVEAPFLPEHIDY